MSLASHVTFPRPAHRMSSVDAGFLYLERPHAPLHVGCLLRFEAPLSRDRLLRHLAARLPRLRRFAQRPVAAPLGLAHPSWEDDPTFMLDAHVQRWGVPYPGREAELAEAAAALLARPLAPSRPLWEAHLLEGLADDASALLLKVHHCMIDGVAGTALLDELLDETVQARSEPIVAAVPPEPPPGAPRRLASALTDSLRGPARGAIEAMGALRAADGPRRSAAAIGGALGWAWHAARGEERALPWNGALGAQRRIVFTRLALLDARWIRSAFGGTINDVVLTALAGGLERWLQWTGVHFEGDALQALVPVSLRAPDDTSRLGNRLSALRVPLPLGLGSERERLAATCVATEALKRERAFDGLALLLGAVELLPASFVAGTARRLTLRAPAHLLATNVPGPRATRYLAGRRVAAMQPIAPLADGLGLAAAVFSYAGALHVGLHADDERVPELEKLSVGIEEAFGALRAGH